MPILIIFLISVLFSKKLCIFIMTSITPFDNIPPLSQVNMEICLLGGASKYFCPYSVFQDLLIVFFIF